MAELKNIKELLSTSLGTEGSLLIVKKIYDTLIPDVEKTLIPRSLAALYFGPGQIPGSSIDVDLENLNVGKVRVVGEGAEIPLDQNEYSSFNVKPVKYGMGIRITKEMMEDSKWDLLQNNIALAGRRMAENENALVISDALDNASNTQAGGAAVTIADITRAIQYIEDADFEASDFIIGNEVATDLRNIDTFVEADKLGSTEMLQRGMIGRLYGLNVFRVSTNAGMTTTSAYVIDRRYAYLIAEKRPITVETFMLPQYDMQAAVVTQRLKVRHIRAQAICKITSS